MMKIDYKLTLSDWKAAIRLHSRQKVGRRIHFAIYDFVFPLLGIVSFALILYARNSEQAKLFDDLIVPVTALIALAIFLPLLRAYHVRKSFKGMFPPSSMGTGYSLDIDEERILSTRPGVGEAKYYWSGIHAVAQNKKIILIFISEILFLGIPISVLSLDQRIELNDLIARHVTNRSK